jgi:uncharacterized membrane protein YhaH (DUF805 family)
MSTPNPYAPPLADVADVPVDAYQAVKMWSAQGRMGRLRYLTYQGVAYLLVIVVSFIAGVIGATTSYVLTGVMVVAGTLGFLLLTLLLTIQRCHDIDWTGWASLLIFVPLVNFLFWFVPGTPGANRFGAPPEPNSTAVKVMAWISGVLGAVFFVGLVAAIALPAYQGYLERARAAQTR